MCFFNNTSTSEIYTLSLHDALPISNDPGPRSSGLRQHEALSGLARQDPVPQPSLSRTTRGRIGGLTQRTSTPVRRAAFSTVDRKSTRLNSSHVRISYAVFCLKKKK